VYESFLKLFLDHFKNIKGKFFFFKKINLGDLDRTTPFSTQFGYDRGGPLDRYYMKISR
jgi:hypothetical protein